ncbi:hypothetical protein F7Q99_22950 [Streptomyces kaniharaensis]|uniref:PNPLA domain-containing protein n=1 Tax=Streptomyces kaniharaensis TaxID=212423 RepID=A0A6N7KZN0_9ACTN|nr:hypothetical protein [Streptomyces kaniharaensis]MQS15043.1 hypothetical protein [Streptomyces kaniharaensis]
MTATTAQRTAALKAPPERGLNRLLTWARRTDPAVRRPAVPAWAGLLLTLGALLPVGTGGLLFRHLAPNVEGVALQLAGSRVAAAGLVGGRGEEHLAALRADAWLTGGAALTLSAAALLGGYVLGRARWRLTALAAGGAGLLAACCGLAADALLASEVDGLASPHGSDAPFAAATALATIRWLLLLSAGPIAAGVLAVTAARAVRGLRARPPVAEGDGSPDRPALIPPWPVATANGGHWPPGPGEGDPDTHHTRWRDGARVPPGREPAELGFCASGGGIRSACVTLGALQSLRPWLKRARYLVSVSGGGYAVGAMQLALSDSAPGSPVRAVSGLTADTVLEPGSPEEDHLRRHSKFIADGAGEWLVALGTLLRGVISAFTLLLAAVLVLGLGLSRFYHLVPLTRLDGLAAIGLTAGGTGGDGGAGSPGALEFRAPALVALAALLATAAVCWLLWLLAFPPLGWDALVPRMLRRLFHGALVLAGLLAAGVLVVPGLAWGAVELQQALAAGPQLTGAGLSLTVVLSYLALLLGILWRDRRTIRRGASAVAGALRGAGRIGGSLTANLPQYVVAWAALAALSAGTLLALGWAVATGYAWPTSVQVLLPLVLGAVGLNLDQTWMSLHPFYRLRLASAFAVRRVAEGGAVVARPYDFFREQTWLSHYAARHPDFPQVIFSAAANLSGDARTPPGRRAVSFTLSHDYVGGPDVGYARTDLLERRTRLHVARDLTVQSAMAVSGAAFSSAMGRQSRVYQGLFAVTNARLGTWLPNPAVLGAAWSGTSDWRRPTQPAVRRLPYQLRELTGRFPMDDRFLLTTDGGHYENLGLVELLRHGVRTAVCIDASGESAYAADLAAAIALAREELGIVITLHEPELLIPGSAAEQPAAVRKERDGERPPLRGLAAQLSARLSARAVITGDIHYPAPLDGLPGGTADEADGRHGTLVVVQAVLTAGMPYELHSYAVANAAFPNDGTSDQWFDHRQFDAYQTLGRYLGEQAAPVIEAALAGRRRVGDGGAGGAGPVPAQPPDGARPASSAAAPPAPRRPAEG